MKWHSVKRFVLICFLFTIHMFRKVYSKKKKKENIHLSFKVLYVFWSAFWFLIESELKADWILAGSSFKTINSRSQA